MWYKYSRNLIDTFEYAKTILSIINEEIVKEVSDYHLGKFKSIGSGMLNLENEARKIIVGNSHSYRFAEDDAYARAYFKKYPNAPGAEKYRAENIETIKSTKESEISRLRGEMSRLQDHLFMLHIIIQPNLEKAMKVAEDRIKETFEDVDNFPSVKLFYDSGKSVMISGEYLDESNLMRLNVFDCLTGDTKHLLSTVAHELSHWKQLFYDKTGYVKSIDKLQKFMFPKLDKSVYFNNPYERQARLSNIMNELSFFKYESGMDFDVFLDNSETWRHIKPFLYDENILSMKKAIYKQITKEK